jgi:FAD/FMN-containing dehydrogenase
VGGLGPGSHRHGALAANVAALEVVTGDGALRRCSRDESRDLYDAVLCGLGRCAAITSAELELRPVRPRVRTYYLLYDDLGRSMEDQRLLARTAGVSSMEGFCSPSMQGLRGTGGQRASFAHWFFPVQVSFEFPWTTRSRRSNVRRTSWSRPGVSATSPTGSATWKRTTGVGTSAGATTGGSTPSGGSIRTASSARCCCRDSPGMNDRDSRP